jgi:hypothetical protein
MDQGPLVTEEIEGAAKFLAAFGKQVPIRVAFWLKDSEEGLWFLYVASDEITDENFDVGYGKVARVARSIIDPWFDHFRVKLLGMDDPLAMAALELSRRHPGRVPLRFRDSSFGGMSVEDAYIYPPPAPVPVQ